MSKTTREEAKTIISDHLAGRQAARDGKPLPAGASTHMIGGYREKSRELAWPALETALRAGRITLAEFRARLDAI